MDGMFIVMIAIIIASVVVGFVKKNVDVGVTTLLVSNLIAAFFLMILFVYNNTVGFDTTSVKEESVEIHSFYDSGTNVYYRDVKGKDKDAKEVSKNDSVIKEVELDEKAYVEVYQKKANSKFIKWLVGDVNNGKDYIFYLSKNESLEG